MTQQQNAESVVSFVVLKISVRLFLVGCAFQIRDYSCRKTLPSLQSECEVDIFLSRYLLWVFIYRHCSRTSQNVPQ